MPYQIVYRPYVGIGTFLQESEHVSSRAIVSIDLSKEQGGGLESAPSAALGVRPARRHTVGSLIHRGCKDGGRNSGTLAEPYGLDHGRAGGLRHAVDLQGRF